MVFVLSKMTEYDLAKSAHRLVWEDLHEHRTDFVALRGSLLAILHELKDRLEPQEKTMDDEPRIAGPKRLQTTLINEAAYICLKRKGMDQEDYTKVIKKAGTFDEIESKWLDAVFNSYILKLYCERFPSTVDKIEIRTLNKGIDALQGRVK